MAQIRLNEIEELASIDSKFCISIYLSTHRKGMEVLNREDQLTFKSELRDIRMQLQEKDLEDRYIDRLLAPAFELLDDDYFWRNLEDCLAVFIAEDFFKIGVYPLEVKPESFIAKEFIISPLLPLINNNASFYLLNLNRQKIQLFKAERFSMEEIDLGEFDIPVHMDDVMKYYEFDKDTDGLGRFAAARQKSGLHFHGHGPDKTNVEYKYLIEYFKQVNNGLSSILGGQSLPLVLAGTENDQGAFRKINSYAFLLSEGISGSFDASQQNDLHAKAVEKLAYIFESSQQEGMEKYEAWAGTGKTSNQFKELLEAAEAGRIESVFFDKNKHVWAMINEEGKLVLNSEHENDEDMDLFNRIAIETLLNKGHAFALEEEFSESSPTGIAAVYRY